MDALIRCRGRLTMLALSLLAAAVSVPGTAAAGGRWGADYFPNVPLIAHDGRVLRFYDDLLEGKAVAINVIYTRCTASCPLETAKLAQVQRLLGDRVGKDVFFYSISIDPKHDTPEVLKAYAERFHVGPGWLFLTGKEEDIELVRKKLALSSTTGAWVRDGHQPALMIGNEPTGDWMRTSSVENPKFLVAAIGGLLGWKDGKPVRTHPQPVQVTPAGRGKYLFQTRCAACHTIGGGDGLGPDLREVTSRRDQQWLARYVAEPDRMLSEGDSLARSLAAKYRDLRMPSVGLDRDEVSAVLSYIEAESRAQSSSSPTGSPARSLTGSSNPTGM